MFERECVSCVISSGETMEFSSYAKEVGFVNLDDFRFILSFINCGMRRLATIFQAELVARYLCAAEVVRGGIIDSRAESFYRSARLLCRLLSPMKFNQKLVWDCLES